MRRADLITKVARVVGAMSLWTMPLFCSAAAAMEDSRSALILPFESGTGHDVIRTDVMIDDGFYADWLYVSLGMLSDSSEVRSRDFWRVTLTEIYRVPEFAARDWPDEFGSGAVSYQF